MPLSLYNTLTRSKAPIAPIVPGRISLYTCGPTVYNYAHIGNLRTYVFEDILRRTLDACTFDVHHVMNVTDVGHLESDADDGEDKLNKASRAQKQSPEEIARFYEAAFFDDCKKLGLVPPSHVCRASEHIPEIIAFIRQLEAKGYTYTVDGNVYFRIAKFPTYCDFARLQRDELQAGARVEVDQRKEDAHDFVLWFSQSKFPNQIMQWDSPWGRGFPGWHIECSVMASKYLGERIDIHCGGIDHIPVHHTNEIAQAEACFGHRWVNVWLHGEFLIIDKSKMAKSGGNFITLKTVTDAGYLPQHYRYFCFGAHYRSELTFSWDALTAARNAFENLRNRIISWKLNPSKGTTDIAAHQSRFWDAMRDDLDMPKALATLWDAAKDSALASSAKLELIRDMDRILGFDVDHLERPTLAPDVQSIVTQREAARAAKDWATADQLRQALLEKGVQLKDTASGTDWYIVYE